MVSGLVKKFIYALIGDTVLHLLLSSRRKKGRLELQTTRFTPRGIRIPVSSVKGKRPWPLDDGGGVYFCIAIT